MSSRTPVPAGRSTPAGTPRQLKYRTALHNSIYDVLKAKNWQETESETDWDFFWADTGWIHQCFDQTRFQEHQRVNHFRNHYELTRKDLLVKNLKRIRRKLEKEGRSDEAARYDFLPTTFVVPTEYALFLEEFKRRSGFGRFTNTPYDNDPEKLEDAFIHLTNVAIQKTSDTYDKNIGCKWFLDDLKQYMIAVHGQEAANTAFSDVQAMIIRTLLSVQATMIQDRHCFELYGFDVLFDVDLRPWLIEVNASPSLTAETESDYELKWGLLYDALTVVDMEKRLSGNETQIGGFDLVYQNGMVRVREGSSVGSMLGCRNDRVDNLRALDQACEKKQ